MPGQCESCGTVMPMTEMTGHLPPTPLDYAPPSRFRRRILRRLIVICMVFVTAALLHHHWPSLKNWYTLARLRHAAMTFTDPPGTIIMNQVPIDTYESWQVNITSHYRSPTPIWRETLNQSRPVLVVGSGAYSNVFLHERCSPSGHRRVVAFTLKMTYGRDGAWIGGDARLFDPRSLLKPRFTELQVKERDDTYVQGHIPNFPGLCTILGTVPWGNDFKLYAGQIDPHDPSRFTIPYDFNGERGEFIGQLHDDDSISLKSADGAKMPKRFAAPATKPSTAQ